MLIVQKYGGTSVANIDRIKSVARRVVATSRRGYDVLVVVSAMAGETDRLINLVHQINENPSQREMDLLLSSGERITAALTAMAIEALGKKAIALTGRQLGLYTDSVHTKAHIEYITGERAKKALKEGNVVVVAGFQGITKDTEEVTTLGRGGSDLSAVAISYALKADLCEIYTDVDGVYTADPNIVKNARKINKITYEEMLELASLGAKVLQSRSVEVAAKFDVPIVVKSSFNYNEGTLITREDKDKDEVPPLPSELSLKLKKLLINSGVKIILEPGRSIVGNAGILLGKVLYTKTGSKTFIITDTGMNDLIRPTLYQAYHQILPVKKARLSRTIFGDLVGPICESGDYIAKDRVIPAFKRGDLFAVMSAGAYGFSMSSNYNARPRAAEVMVDGKRAFLIRERESYQDLIRGCRL